MTQYVGNFNLDELGVRRSSKVVDVGCADGVFARQLAAAGLSVVGVEPSRSLRAAFREAARATGLHGRATVVDGRAESLPFEDASVDSVVMTEVLEHVEDPAAALAEIARVLSPGGSVCVSVPTSLTERLFSALHPRYLKNATHRRIFRKPDLLDALDTAGLDVRRLEGRNFAASVLWVGHALLRSEADHTGKIHDHVWLTRAIDRVWVVLEKLCLKDPLVRLGNRLMPKSWYVYAKRRAEE